MKNNYNIVLIGFMGSGKTTIGNILGKKLNKNFIDIDPLIEKNAGMSIVQIFDKFGEEYFRSLERDAIFSLKNISNSVISTGGGSFCDEQNINILTSIGKIIYLKTSYKSLISRFTNKEIIKRPLLSDLKKLNNLLVEREKYYLQADYCILTDEMTTEDISKQIIKLF